MFERYRGLAEWNIRRSMESNGVSFDYYDPEEYDPVLSVGENIRNVLGARGIRTREEWRAEMRRWVEMSTEPSNSNRWY